MGKDRTCERGRGRAPIMSPADCPQGTISERISTSLITQDGSPPSGSRPHTIAHPEGDASGARNYNHPVKGRCTGSQRGHGIVRDDRQATRKFPQQSPRIHALTAVGCGVRS